LAFSWIRLNLGFLLRENSLLYLSNLPLGVPNWTVIYTITHRHSNVLASFADVVDGAVMIFAAALEGDA
jgi:hypothetical protein